MEGADKCLPLYCSINGPYIIKTVALFINLKKSFLPAEKLAHHQKLVNKIARRLSIGKHILPQKHDDGDDDRTMIAISVREFPP